MSVKLIDRRWLLCSSLLLAGALSGCTSDMDDLNKYVAGVKARKSTQIEPIPQMKAYEPVPYVVEGRRDPFIAALPDRNGGGDVPASAVRPDLARNKEPLEEFPLDALRLSGVIRFNGRIYAMVKAPDGVIHRVTVGDHLGQNYGTINKVSEAEVNLTEIIPDGFGGYIERPASLAANE